MKMGQLVIISQTFAPLIPPTYGGPLPFTWTRASMGLGDNNQLSERTI